MKMCRVTSMSRRNLDHAKLKCMSCGSEWDETFPELENNQELIVGEWIPDMCKSCDSEDKTAIVVALVYSVLTEENTK